MEISYPLQAKAAGPLITSSLECNDWVLTTSEFAALVVVQMREPEDEDHGLGVSPSHHQCR